MWEVIDQLPWLEDMVTNQLVPFPALAVLAVSKLEPRMWRVGCGMNCSSLPHTVNLDWNPSTASQPQSCPAREISGSQGYSHHLKETWSDVTFQGPDFPLNLNLLEKKRQENKTTGRQRLTSCQMPHGIQVWSTYSNKFKKILKSLKAFQISFLSK